MRFANYKIYATLIAILIFVPTLVNAQTPAETEIFEARVVEILDEQELVREDGSTNLQQNLKLKGLSGAWQDKEFEFHGISELDVISSNAYEVGDKVMVAQSKNYEGNLVFYITDYVRSTAIYVLIGIFALVVFAVGRWKGLRALAGLIISFFIIIKFIIPQILGGHNPLIIGVIGAFVILALTIYITEGFQKKSHLALLTIFIGLIITSLLAIFFTKLAHLSGLAQEEILFLVDVGRGTINFSGLLLAGILIGTIGALDDVVISQIEAVIQLKKANPSLAKPELFKMVSKIGHTHMGAMINTLFLAYAGASLPLLLLFNIKQEPFLSLSQIINHEMIAVEIIRTLVGSMGIVLAIPISTIIAVHFISEKDTADTHLELH
ncbi:MAG: YibE/F family protein [bacterium]|nr:YibE/F family protein [bacterium]